MSKHLEDICSDLSDLVILSEAELAEQFFLKSLVDLLTLCNDEIIELVTSNEKVAIIPSNSLGIASCLIPGSISIWISILEMGEELMSSFL